jgi:hypothetical protein
MLFYRPVFQDLSSGVIMTTEMTQRELAGLAAAIDRGFF